MGQPLNPLLHGNRSVREPRLKHPTEICARSGCVNLTYPSNGSRPSSYCSEKCSDTDYRDRHREERRAYDRERTQQIIADPERRAKKVRSIMDSAKRTRQPIRKKLSKMGVTLGEYDALVAKGCPVCPAGRDGGHWHPHIDHDHALGFVPGAFRGVLCRDCNLALGQLKDDPDRIEELRRYILGYLEKRRDIRT